MSEFNLVEELQKDEIDNSKLLLASQEIYSYFINKNEGLRVGEIFNHYVKHVINRVVGNKELKGIYLCNIFNIYNYIKNRENGDFLQESGLNLIDIPRVSAFIIKIISSERWKKIILDELNICTEEDAVIYGKVSNLTKFAIEEELIARIQKSYKFNYREYLFLTYKKEVNIDGILSVFNKKADGANIKYPVEFPLEKRSGEYIFLTHLLQERRERSEKYKELIEYVLESKSGRLSTLAFKQIESYDPTYKKTFTRYRVEELMENTSDSEYLQLLKDVLDSLSEGDLYERI